MPKSSGLKGKSHLISPSKYTTHRLFYRNRFIEVPLHPAFMLKVPCNLVSGEHEKDGQGGREEGVSTLTFVLDEALHLLLDAVVPVGDVHV